jgi:hypothetical protein
MAAATVAAGACAYALSISSPTISTNNTRSSLWLRRPRSGTSQRGNIACLGVLQVGHSHTQRYLNPRDCAAEIARSGADVVCLQEIDLRLYAALYTFLFSLCNIMHMYTAVAAALKSSGYSCTAVEPRARGVVATQGLSNSAFKVQDRMQDGVMVAFKPSAVTLIDSWSEHLAAPPPNGHQPDGCAAAAAAFRHKGSEQVFAVASLHLRPAADAGVLLVVGYKAANTL